MKHLYLLSAFLALPILSGCADVQKVADVVKVESQIIVAAEPCLVEEYKREQEQCLTDHADRAGATACVTAVRLRWHELESSVSSLRTLRCTIEPDKCHPGEGLKP